MSDFGYPTTRLMNQDWMAEFDDWDGDGDVDIPGGFYHSIGWDGHNGLDFLCPKNDPVYASNSGTVEFAGPAGDHWLLSGGGNAVLLAHPEHRVRTEYLHFTTVVVEEGQQVGKGQLLGYSGMTGAANGYHLHFGFLPLENVDLNNRARGRIDPYPYLTGGIFAAGIINAVQKGTTVALDLKDLEAIQALAQTERKTIVNEIRFGLSELGKALKDSTYELKVWDQKTDHEDADRVINDNRAEEAKTREALAAAKDAE